MYSNEELLNELREATKEKESEITYDYFNERKGPSCSTLENRFGSFTQAKRKAGVSEKEKYGKLPVNSSFFDNINNSKKAYWLGMMYGDGWIQFRGSTKEIGLGLIDKDHIEKFKEALNSSHQITEHDKEEENSSWRLCLADDKLVKSLQEKGCDSEKTNSEKLPDIKEKYYPDFVRGLFDADGNYQERGNTFKLHGANKKRFKKLIEWLPSEAAITKEDRKYCLRVAQHHGVEDLWKWLYPQGKNTEPALERKLKQIHD